MGSQLFFSTYNMQQQEKMPLRSHSKHHFSKCSPDFICTKMRSRPKFAIFVRDVPEIGRLPMSMLFLTELRKYDLIPVYYYSAIELMKNPKNLKKMRSFTLKTQQESTNSTALIAAFDPSLIAKGCNGVIKHLFQRAMRSNPEIILVDYFSETLVDAEKLSEIAKNLDYSVFFLKKQLHPMEDYAVVQNAVKAISSGIKFQNHAEIRLQREADKYWHELNKIFIPTEKDYPINIPEDYNLPYLMTCKIPLTESIHTSKLSRHPSIEFLISFQKQAECYYGALENLAISIDGPIEEILNFPNIFNTAPNQRNHYETIQNGSEYTLIVVDDSKIRPTKPRLFEVLMEKFVKEEDLPPYHVVPIGELLILQKFQDLFSWFCHRSDMSLPDTYSFLFIDAFNMLYSENEKIIIVDNLHEGIVRSSYYIRKALEKQWEILIIKRDSCWTWPSADDEIVDSTLNILRRKYCRVHDNSFNANFQQLSINHENNAFGDYFLQ